MVTLSSSGEKLSPSALIRLFYQRWILDQYYYDVIAYKTKMLACYVQEYYNPTSIACFVNQVQQRFEGFRNSVLEKVLIAEENVSALDFCLKEFNEYLTQIWVDIGLMDHIISQVDTYFLKDFNPPPLKKRYFQPLIKLKTSFFHSNLY